MNKDMFKRSSNQKRNLQYKLRISKVLLGLQIFLRYRVGKMIGVLTVVVVLTAVATYRSNSSLKSYRF